MFFIKLPLKVVFPLSQRGEGRYVTIQRLSEPVRRRLPHARLGSAQKNVDLPFQADGRGQAGGAGGTGRAARLMGRNRRIGRFHHPGKAKIGFGVLMAAIHGSVWRQGRQSLQRTMQFGRGAFKQPAAAGGKQRIAAEQRPMAAHIGKIGNVPAGVAGYGQHCKTQPQGRQVELLPVSQYRVGDSGFARAIHRDAEAFAQGCSAGGVVRMMVRDEYGNRGELLGAQNRFHRRRLARVHNRHPAWIFGAVNQPDVIVPQGRNGLYMQCCHARGWYRMRRGSSSAVYHSRMDETTATWFTTPLGARLLATETRLAGTLLADAFGQDGVQLGQWGGPHAFAPCLQTRHHVRVACSEAATQTPQVRAHPERLPFASDSVDVLLLPHVLEFAASPHAVVRETERVLLGEGRLLIFGFNPWSLFGLRRRFGSREFPWQGRFISERRLRDWLKVLGLDVVATHRYGFCPPLQHAGLLDGLRGLEHIGPHYLARVAGAYAVLAHKRRFARPPRKLIAQSVPASVSLAKPVTRSSS